MTLEEPLRLRELEEQAGRAERVTYPSRSLEAMRDYMLLKPSPEAMRADVYPILLLLHGFAGSCTDWLKHTRIATATSGSPVFVVMPSGGMDWYTNAFDGSRKSEDDLLHDLVMHLIVTLPVAPEIRPWAIGGNSMGGYGAVKCALKRPDLFRVAFSHSGAFGVTRQPKESPVFGDPEAHAGVRMREDVVWLAEQAMGASPLERPNLLLDCGQNDMMVEQSRQFAHHLAFLGYPHVYRETPGYHSWPYWDRALRSVLPEALAGIVRS
jgi:S-formylglutathione hydrolase FrmB